MTSFYSPEELQNLGLKSVGEHVRISRRASFYGADQIEIGDYVRIDDFCVLSGGTGIKLGNYIHIACYTGLFGGGGIQLGDFCNISSRICIYSESDDFSGRSMTNPVIPMAFKPHYISAPVTLGRHVIVGTNSTLLPGVNLADGVAIGAHSLVSENCHAWHTYAGNPVKKIKPRSQELLQYEGEFLKTIRESSP